MAVLCLLGQRPSVVTAKGDNDHWVFVCCREIDEIQIQSILHTQHSIVDTIRHLHFGSPVMILRSSVNASDHESERNPLQMVV